MALREVEGPAGAPWERPMHGTLDRLVVESELLAGNPLGDPARRPLYVYRPPGVELDHPRALPVVYVIQGYTGQLDMWRNRVAFEPTMVERVDAMFAGGDCPDALVVFVDCWTSYGGSQFLNSAALGRYQDYLCDEVVAFVEERYPALADRESRGAHRQVVRRVRRDGRADDAAGRVRRARLARRRRAVRGLLPAGVPGRRAHAARRVRRLLRVVLRAPRGADHVDWSTCGSPLEMYGYAAAYSPDPANPGKALLPFDVATGRLHDDIWALWLDKDPVRMAPAHAEALRSMRRIYLDAGRSDEYYLDLGAQAFAAELDALGVEYTLDLFAGKHGGLTYRYPGAIRELVLALSR